MAFTSNGMKLILAAVLASAALALVSASSSSITSKYQEFTYYMHAYGSGPNVTGYDLLNPVAGQETTHFGQLRAFDALLRKSDSVDSKYVGHARGYAMYDALDKAGVDVYWCSYFYGVDNKPVVLSGVSITSGSGLCYRAFYYSGSASWEKVVVGGTGDFRFCKGYTVETPISEDPDTGLEIYKIKVHALCDKISDPAV